MFVSAFFPNNLTVNLTVHMCGFRCLWLRDFDHSFQLIYTFLLVMHFTSALLWICLMTSCDDQQVKELSVPLWLIYSTRSLGKRFTPSSPPYPINCRGIALRCKYCPTTTWGLKLFMLNFSHIVLLNCQNKLFWSSYVFLFINPHKQMPCEEDCNISYGHYN